VPHEVRPRLEEAVEPDGLVVVVDEVHVRARRETAAVRDDELEAIRERALSGPRRIAVHDASVEEEDAR
jgi:hypothetical protein